MNGDEDESNDWSGSLAPFEDSDAHFGRGFSDSNLSEHRSSQLESHRRRI